VTVFFVRWAQIDLLTYLLTVSAINVPVWQGLALLIIRVHKQKIATSWTMCLVTAHYTSFRVPTRCMHPTALNDRSLAALKAGMANTWRANVASWGNRYEFHNARMSRLGASTRACTYAVTSSTSTPLLTSSSSEIGCQLLY